MTTAMKFPAVFGLANASVEVVVVPASFPTCWTKVIPAACACQNPPPIKRRSRTADKRTIQLRIAEELRRQLIDIRHPPKKTFFHSQTVCEHQAARGTPYLRLPANSSLEKHQLGRKSLDPTPLK